MKIALAAIDEAGGTVSLGDVIKAVEAKVSLNAYGPATWAGRPSSPFEIVPIIREHAQIRR